MLKLYSTDCPRCIILEKKLIQKEIEFEKIAIEDPEKFVELGFTTAPILYDDETGDYMDFSTAVNHIK